MREIKSTRDENLNQSSTVNVLNWFTLPRCPWNWRRSVTLRQSQAVLAGSLAHSPSEAENKTVNTVQYIYLL